MTQKSSGNLHGSAIPGWLLEKDNNIADSGGSGSGFLRRTANGVSRMLQDDLLAERYAAKGLFLQGIDPRLKLVTFIVLLILTAVSKSPVSLMLLAATAFMLAVLSGLGAWVFIRRVWFVLPLLLLVFSIPAATNIIIPGKPVLTIFGSSSGASIPWLAGGLSFTLEGIRTVLKMFLRSGVSVSFCYLLIMTTRWSNLTASLRAFRIPVLFVSILDMTYRFIFVLIKVSIDIFEARYLRTVGKVRNRENRKFISSSIALLFAKSSHMSEEIYDSMLSRCYTGEPSGLKSFGFTGNDLVWAFNFVVMVFIILLF